MSQQIAKRQYHKVTPAQMAKFKALEALLGNATAAVRAISPTILEPSHRAWRMQRKAKEQNTTDFIDDSLQLIGIDAVNRVGKLVNSTDEKIATKNSQYVIDHLRGMPLRRSESKHLALTIEAVLD